MIKILLFISFFITVYGKSIPEKEDFFSLFAKEVAQKEKHSKLHLAVMQNSFDEVLQLLIAKVKINQIDAFGATPLHYVKTAAMAQLLLLYNADPQANELKTDFSCSPGLKPLDIARGNNYADVVRVLEKITI